jgi:hypothetical protein
MCAAGWLAAAALGVSPAPAAAQTSAPAPGEAPELAFEQTRIDFGEAPQGPTLRRTFSFVNRSKHPVWIHSVTPSCGCTTALPTPRVIEPGARGAIEVEFQTFKVKVHGARQRFDNVFAVRGIEHGRRGELGAPMSLTYLRLTGVVVSPYRLVPEAGAYLRARPSQEPQPARVVIYPRADAEKALTGVQLISVPRGVAVDPPRAIRREGALVGLAVTVRVRDDAPPGPIEGLVTIRAAEGYQDITFPVQGEVFPAVVAQPRRLGGSDEGAFPTAIRLSGRSGKAPALIQARVLVHGEAEGSAEEAWLRLGAPQPEGEHLVVPVSLEVPEGVSKGRGGSTTEQRGEVLLWVANARTPVVRVPYVVHNDEAEGAAEAQRHEAARAVGLRLSVAQLDLGSLYAGQSRSAAVTVTGLSGALPPALTAQIEAGGEDPEALKLGRDRTDRSERIDVRLAPTLPGTLRGALVLRTEQGEVSLPLSARVRSRFLLTPEAVYLEGPGSRKIALRDAAGAEPVKIEAVRCLGPGIEARIERAEGQAAKIVVSRLAPAKADRGSRWVAVDVSSTTQETIRIPVFGGRGSLPR